MVSAVRYIQQANAQASLLCSLVSRRMMVSRERSGESRRGALRQASNALYSEIVRFRFDYPLVIVPEAGPKETLHYYLYSDSLSWSAMRMDSEGIPREWERITGVVYRPDYIACYGLSNLGLYLRNGNPTHLETFLRQVDWLEKHAIIREDGAAVWPNDFDYREGPVLLRAPWLSANTTGFVVSALVRGWRVTRRPRLLELLKRSAAIFDLDYDRNGIRMPMDGHFLYTEKPGLPAPGILDGFLRSLLGLYDLSVELNEPGTKRLFAQGVAALKYALHKWDYKNRWSWYGNRAYLSPPQYHSLNRFLLLVVARLSGEPLFSQYADNWDPENLSWLQKTEIYLTFLATKNHCRIKNQTWKHHVDSSFFQKVDSSSSELSAQASLPSHADHI